MTRSDGFPAGAVARVRGGLLACAAVIVGFVASSCTPDPHPVSPPQFSEVDSAAIRAGHAARRSVARRLQGTGPRVSLDWVKYHGVDTFTFSPSHIHCSQNCGTLEPNTAPITVRLSRKAVTIEVTSDGPFKCSGTMPEVNGYDYTGRVVATATMSIDSPADCDVGNDDMSWGQTAWLTSEGAPIAYIVISPPAPWTFEVPNSSGGTTTARTLLDYDVRVISAGPAEAPCNYGSDTLLASSPALRQGLLDVLRKSRWWDEDHSLRKEYGGMLVRQPDGSLKAVELVPESTPCGKFKLQEADAMFAANDSSVVALYHSHDGAPGDVITCEGVAETYYPQKNGLNSKPDTFFTAWVNAIRWQNGLPYMDVYYIDGHEVNRIPGTEKWYVAGQRSNNTVLDHRLCRFQ